VWVSFGGTSYNTNDLIMVFKNHFLSYWSENRPIMNIKDGVGAATHETWISKISKYSVDLKYFGHNTVKPA